MSVVFTGLLAYRLAAFNCFQRNSEIAGSRVPTSILDH